MSKSNFQGLGCNGFSMASPSHISKRLNSDSNSRTAANERGNAFIGESLENLASLIQGQYAHGVAVPIFQ